jgi:predicted RNA-binding Zn ribbon-like protein
MPAAEDLGAGAAADASAAQITIALVNTIRVMRGKRGQLRDLLATPDSFTEWVDGLARLLPPGMAEITDLDEDVRSGVVLVRGAVRSLFAHAIAPNPPSYADADDLMPLDKALLTINGVLAAAPTVVQLRWAAEDNAPQLSEGMDPAAPRSMRLMWQLSTQAAGFLSSPKLADLRACSAPLCVKYFVKSRHRQQWCSSECGNRARVARHYYAHQAGASSRAR